MKHTLQNNPECPAAAAVHYARPADDGPRIADLLELKAQKDLMSPITPHHLTQVPRSSGRQAGGTRLRGVSCLREATIPLTTDQDDDTSPKKTRDSGCGGRGLLLQDHGLAEIYEINKKNLATWKCAKGASRFDPANDVKGWHHWQHQVSDIDARDLRHTHDEACFVFRHGSHNGKSVDGWVWQLIDGHSVDAITPLVVVVCQKIY